MNERTKGQVEGLLAIGCLVGSFVGLMLVIKYWGSYVCLGGMIVGTLVSYYVLGGLLWGKIKEWWDNRDFILPRLLRSTLLTLMALAILTIAQLLYGVRGAGELVKNDIPLGLAAIIPVAFLWGLYSALHDLAKESTVTGFLRKLADEIIEFVADMAQGVALTLLVLFLLVLLFGSSSSDRSDERCTPIPTGLDCQ